MYNVSQKFYTPRFLKKKLSPMADNFKKFTPTTKTEDKFGRVKIPLYPLGYAPVCNTWHETLHVTIGYADHSDQHARSDLPTLVTESTDTKNVLFSCSIFSRRTKKEWNRGGGKFSPKPTSVFWRLKCFDTAGMPTERASIYLVIYLVQVHLAKNITIHNQHALCHSNLAAG